MTVPAGFVAYRRPSRYFELIGPVYEALEDASVVGLLIDERHTNSRGFVHGGLLVAVADAVMGHSGEREGGEGRRLVSVSLTTDFLGSARCGEWVQGRARVRRAGRTLTFAEATFTASGRTVLAASGIFAASAPRPGA
jgi:uncharacterized protein (TIGR00369 family)